MFSLFFFFSDFLTKHQKPNIFAPFPEFFSFLYFYERFLWRTPSSLELPWVPLSSLDNCTSKKCGPFLISFSFLFINISFSTSAFILNLFEYFSKRYYFSSTTLNLVSFHWYIIWRKMVKVFSVQSKSTKLKSLIAVRTSTWKSLGL